MNKYMKNYLKICKNCNKVYMKPEDFFNSTSRWRMDDNKNLYFNCSCNSTLVLKRGSYEWYSPEKYLSPKAFNYFCNLNLKDAIPQITETINTLQEVIKNPLNNVNDIVYLIKKEPILTSDVLKLANYKNNRRNDTEINSLEQACITIGRDDLNALVTLASLRIFSFNTKKYTNDIFWKESLLAGNIGEFVLKKMQFNQSTDEIYLACALSNIGKILGAIFYPNSIDSIYDLCYQNKCDWNTAEDILNAPKHEVLGEIGAIFWNLPNFILYAAGNYNYTIETSMVEKYQCLVDIAAFSNQAMHWLLNQKYRINPDILNNSYKRLNFKLNVYLFLDILNIEYINGDL